MVISQPKSQIFFNFLSWFYFLLSNCFEGPSQKYEKARSQESQEAHLEKEGRQKEDQAHDQEKDDQEKGSFSQNNPNVN